MRRRNLERSFKRRAAFVDDGRNRGFYLHFELALLNADLIEFRLRRLKFVMGGTRCGTRLVDGGIERGGVALLERRLARKVVHPCGGRFFQILQHVVQRLDALARDIEHHEVALCSLFRVLGTLQIAHAFAMLARE